MKIKWCGVFKNVSAGHNNPPNFSTIQEFVDDSMSEIRFRIRVFVREMESGGFELTDQEIMDVQD